MKLSTYFVGRIKFNRIKWENVEILYENDELIDLAKVLHHTLLGALFC